MKQLLILSGKGGTGKTTVASAFIKLADAKAYADCDVDAPNLHLISEWNVKSEKTDYYGLSKAKINTELCIQCDQCRQNCRFDAISIDGKHKVDPFACEGCGVCTYVCPVSAITMLPAVAGELMLYSDNEKVFSTAQLKMGSGTSGMLVTEVKKQMKLSAIDTQLAIIDGSPGIGCPVIASLSGVDMVLIVAEPSISGISDMERIINTATKSGVKTAICTNKFDTNIEKAEKIEDFCQRQGLPFIGKIPFDYNAVKAINNGQTIVDIDCISGTAVKRVYEKVMKLLFKEDGMSKHSTLAKDLFKKGYSCSQSVVLAFCDEMGLDAETALKISSSFGGGMGRLREACGAVTGMFIVAGMLDGYSDPTDKIAKAEHYKRIQSLAMNFKNENKSIVCRELLGLSVEKESHIPEERNKSYYKKRPCAELVEYAAKILDEYILNKKSEENKMMKIAVASENEIVTEHFGHCLNFNIFEIEKNQIVKSESIENPGHKPGFLPNFLNDMGVNVIISGGMGSGAIEIFNEKNIEVIVGAKGSAKTTVNAYLQGSLKSSGSVCHEHQHSDECGE